MPKRWNVRTESVYLAISLSIALSLSQRSMTFNKIPTGGGVPKVVHTHKAQGHPYTYTHTHIHTSWMSSALSTG